VADDDRGTIQIIQKTFHPASHLLKAFTARTKKIPQERIVFRDVRIAFGDLVRRQPLPLAKMDLFQAFIHAGFKTNVFQSQLSCLHCTTQWTDKG